jgi:DNA-directed RNA polymerase subunit alpha
VNLEIDLTGLVLPERIEIAEESADGHSADFVLEPLERGYGHTLGNAVRRVLLSSLQGAAVRAFRIEGVVHEHQTISSVVEDVHQVIQNLKSLVVSLDDDIDEVVLEVQVKKKGPVTARRIRGPASVTIHDPDHHLLTLADDREVHMELHVNKGRGFVLADQQPLPPGAPVDLVRIDAIYNPVLRANFTVEETRVGQRTDFDRLTIRVETDGSVDPAGAVRYAAELVRCHLRYMLYFAEGGLPEAQVRELAPVPEEALALMEKPIDDVAEISVRSRNALQLKSIHTMGDLIERTEEDLLRINNFGKKSLAELYNLLDEHGLGFGMMIEQDEDGQLFYVKEGAAADVEQ